MMTLWEIIKSCLIFALMALVATISLAICGFFTIMIMILFLFNTDENSFNCLNYCMDSLYTSEIAVVVQDSATKKPIAGASVTIRESPVQPCPVCWNHLLPTTMITDEDGIFRYDLGFPDTYVIEIMIQAENCTSLLSYRTARQLNGGIIAREGRYFFGDTFILDCQL